MRGINLPKALEGNPSLHLGMNSFDAPWLIPEGSAAYIQNVEVDVLGRAWKTRGVTSIGAVSAPSNTVSAQGLWKHWDTSVGRPVLAGIWNQNLYLFDGTGVQYTCGSGASFVFGLHYAASGTYTRSQKASYIFSVVGADSAASLASRLTILLQDRSYTQCASHCFRYATWWQQRLWGIDNAVALNDQTLWYSNLQDGGTIPNDQSLEVESGRGGKLVACVPIRNTSGGAPAMILFKERLIAVIVTYWGSSSGLIPVSGEKLDLTASSIQIVSDNFGCVAPRSIQSIPGAQAGEIMFLSHDGFRALMRAGDDTISSASLPISRIIQDYVDRINFTQVHKAVSGVWNRKYWCAVPLDGAIDNTHTFCYDLNSGAWTVYTLKARDYATDPQNQQLDQLWMQVNHYATDSVASGPASGWHVYRTFFGEHFPNNEDIFYQVDSRAISGKSIQQKKRWDWFALQGFANQATTPMEIFTKLDDGEWSYLGQLVLPLVGGILCIFGETPLPWSAGPNNITLQKINLTDLKPSYLLQLRFGSTSASDHGRPCVINSSIKYNVIDPEFDNEIT